MNTSTGIVVAAVILRISAIDNSLASTTRANPNSAATAIVSALVSDICVDAWISISGHTPRINLAKPKSCTNTASTPESAIRRITSTAASISDGNTNVFIVA